VLSLAAHALRKATVKLRLVALVDRFNEIERELPADWADARLSLTVEDHDERQRAGALLGPLQPGHSGTKLRFATARRGGGASPELMRRLLRRLDDAGIYGELELVSAHEAPGAELPSTHQLRDQWKRALDGLPADWSDLYAEVRFDSTDYVEPGALLLAPVNPSRFGEANALRFRCAHHFGYGVSPEMATRCFERLDEAGFTGEVEVLRALSDTNPVGTQGPVWVVGGRAV
jgi:hypothetical protein